MKASRIIKPFYACIVGTGIVINQTLTIPSTLAQITRDNTVGTQVENITQDGILTITGGEQRGGNLFHSFEQFSVPNGTTANFQNSSTINNIINRVTGSSLSNIEGRITANGIAHFILINPNGVTFGPNAQIDINGSFLATTAESMTFADGIQFSATNPQPNPLLTMSVPVGLQFGINPGTIVNRANNLNLNPGHTFALVGGDIEFPGGNLTVPQGRVELGSVGSNSQVQLRTTGVGFELGYEGVETFRDISLFQQASVTANNSAIQLQAQNIRISEQAQVRSDTRNSQPGGNLTVNAFESIEISDGLQQRQGGPTSGLFATVVLGATGQGGKITVNTKKVILREGGRISAEVGGTGNGGTINVNASESIEIIGTGFFGPSFIATNTVNQADGGPININTKKLTLQDGGQISAVSVSIGRSEFLGNAGEITINASELINVNGTGGVTFNNSIVPSRITSETGFQDLGLSGFAPGGSVNINTNQLTVTNGGIISAASLGQGNAGNVNITAHSIFLDNQGVITASSEGTGNAGNLTINTDQLTVNNRSEVAVRSIGTGQGGNLTLNAQSIALDNNSQLTATSEALDPETARELGLDPDILELDNGLANAGSLTIATDNLRVNNNSEVTVSSFGLGNAGNMNVQAENIFLDNSSRLSAETASGEGGNINLDVDQFLTLRRNSTISTTAGTTGGLGNGGNIDINALFMIAVPTENSDIIANAFLGRGGNISIDAAGVFGIEERERLTPLSDITASSQFGQVGNIGINRPDVDPQRSLVKLPEQVVDTSNIVVDACRPGGALTRGEFTITGRGGLPSNPNEGVDNPTGLTELGYPNTDSLNSIPLEQDRSSPTSEEHRHQSETHTPTLVEAQGWIINADGNVVLTAQAPAVTPHSPGLSPATCYDLSTRNSSP
ncbi:S-layer family protein [Cyanothece sp. BG0011]|uniref:beta strand repeat-containing protein n=1 Tax=Cyanothece sp. BG0011 TaxID=2082950 RepID=UPI000D1F70DA|nr:S-layer family protein [Cyanothece sp. BG0011]